MLKKTYKKWFKNWPKKHQYCFFAILLGFWIFGTAKAISIGDHYNEPTDGTSEIANIFAAKRFVSHGFMENYLLPTYPGHGYDSVGQVRHKPYVYSHFLPGQAWLLGIIFKIFGTNKVYLGRIFSHTLSVLALAFLCFQFAKYTKSTVLACLLAALLLLPKSFSVWTICIDGHSYTTAFFIFFVGFILYFAIKRKTRNWVPWVGAAIAGYLQMFFGFDWVPLTAISILGFVAIFPEISMKHGLALVMGYFIGACLAAGTQFILASFYFGSMGAALQDYIHWGTWRSTGDGPVPIHDPSLLKLPRMLRFMNRQSYGSTGFHAVQLIVLSIVSLLLGFLARIKPAKQLYRGIVGVLFLYLGSVIWIILMRQHSYIHVFYVNRHFFSLYLGFVLIALPIFHTLVVRTRGVKK